MADLYDHLDEKSKSEKKDLCADSTFLCWKVKISSLGAIDPEKTLRRKIFKIRGLS